jgi:hypothetical protein
MAAGKQESSPNFRLTRTHFSAVILVSAFYFADIFLKASQKCYWFDELFTVYLCRTPHFSNLWSAVLHGADFNPPLFYLLTRASRGLFGNGLIATRLPATLGVWLFGLCLFLFVARRAGVVCGFIAGMFPFFTLSQYYAYEARAHGLVLGWCGLSLLCWQRHGEGGRFRSIWLAGFALSLLGALLTHVYAVYLFVPFAVVEFYSLLKRERPNWDILGAMLLVLVPVVLVVYLPLFRIYRSSVRSGFFVPSHEVFQRFLLSVFGPALCILLLALMLFGVQGLWRTRLVAATKTITRREMLLAIGFLCVPVLGFVGCRISHGPFLDRYFLSSIAGFSILLGYAHSYRPAGSWCAQALAGSMLLLMIADLGLTIYLVKTGNRIVLQEPSTGLRVNTTPSDPMLMYKTVLLDQSGLDILVPSSFDYFYFFEYAPRTVVSHLYFSAAADNVNLGLYQKLGKWLPVDFQTTALASFLENHKKFLMYADNSGSVAEAVQAIANRGYRLVSAEWDGSGIMYEYAR